MIALTGLILIHLVTERLILKRITETEKRKLREKIAMDLHDDLASTLSTISIYSDTLKMESKSNPDQITHKIPDKISDLTHSAKQSITDIIWMTSPRNDTLQSLFVKITSMMADTFQEKGIHFINTVKIPDENISLDEAVKNNLFLILKEGMNNILKHANATEVILNAELEKNSCTVELQDDGIGIGDIRSKRSLLHGHGITNMYRRASESGIRFDIQSGTVKGTTVRLVFSISPERGMRREVDQG